MSNSNQAVEAAIMPSRMLGSEPAFFKFPPSKQSSRADVSFGLTPPPGTQTAVIALQSYDLQYTNNKQYGYGRMQISLRTTPNEASCSATLRDDKTNEREWEGTVTGIVTFYG
jgi:hypothetical protein